MPILLDLFLTFAKIGLFTFGGGYAMLAVIDSICVEKKKWISHEDMMNVTVIAESTPGPISINCATFVGYKQGGFRGAVLATLGVVLPSFVIIYIISIFLDDFLSYTLVASAFRGIRIAVGILILRAAWNMIRKMKKNTLSVVILAVSTAVILTANLLARHFSTIVLLLAAAGVSLAVYLAQRRKGGLGE